MERTADPRHASCVRTCRASSRGPLIAVVRLSGRMKKLSLVTGMIGIALLIQGCASSRVNVAPGRAEREFLLMCQDLAHSNAFVRFANRYPGPHTNALRQAVCPILQSDKELVRAAEKLFLQVYVSLPPEQKVTVAPQLVTFGTTGTWAMAKSEVSHATYSVRSAIVGELLNQLVYGVTGRVEMVEVYSSMEYALGFLRGLGWCDERPVNSEWSIDEIPAVVADRLINDTEIHTVQVVDRNPFLPFISTRGTYSSTISSVIALDVLDFGVTSPEIVAALETIRASKSHPTKELLVPEKIAEQTLPPVSGTRGTPAAYAPAAPGIPER